MNKMDGKSMDLIGENISRLKELFPEAVTEGKIDFGVLKELLGGAIENRPEYYKFTWNGKEEARAYARTRSMGTLRPCEQESSGKDGIPGKFDSDNLYIEGDNLEVLKLLQGGYHERIKMIYIDPPYNTGKDFVYPDDYRRSIPNYKALTGQVDDEGKATRANPETSGRYHTDWLNMMYPRLILARNLLSDDGVIFISIDDSEQDNLKKLCNEVFGEENHVGTLIIQTATDNNQTQINTEHEYMLCYAKDSSCLTIWERESEAADKIYKQYIKYKRQYGNNPSIIQQELRGWIRANKNDLPRVSHYDNVDEKGVFHDGDIANTKFGGYRYEILHPVTGNPCKIPEKGFRFPETTMKEMIKNNNILFGSDETTLIKPKKRLEDVRDSLKSVIYEDGRASTKAVDNLLGRDVFKNPKSHFILSRLIDFCTNDGDLILDFFAGSSSFAHAMFLSNISQKVKRNFILVQIPELIVENNQDQKQSFIFCKQNNLAPNICEIGKERIRRAGKKLKDENPLFTGDIGFKVFKLDTSNFVPWNPTPDTLREDLFASKDNVLLDRRTQDLLYEILLKCNLPLTLPIEAKAVGENTVYIVGMGALAICLDKNIPASIAEAIVEFRDEYDPEVSMQVVFRDNGFNDVSKTNALQILKQAGFEEKSIQTL